MPLELPEGSPPYLSGSKAWCKGLEHTVVSYAGSVRAGIGCGGGTFHTDPARLGGQQATGASVGFPLQEEVSLQRP